MVALMTVELALGFGIGVSCVACFAVGYLLGIRRGIAAMEEAIREIRPRVDAQRFARPRGIYE
jgi:hypothetical protein